MTRRSRNAEPVWEVVNADAPPSDETLEALATLLLDLVEREEREKENQETKSGIPPARFVGGE